MAREPEYFTSEYFIDEDVLAFSAVDAIYERSRFYDFQWPQPLGIAGALVLHLFFVVSIILMKPIEKTPEAIFGFDIVTLPSQDKIIAQMDTPKSEDQKLARDIPKPKEIQPNDNVPIEPQLPQTVVQQALFPPEQAPPPPILEQQKEVEKEAEEIPITPRAAMEEKMPEQIKQNKIEAIQKPLENQLNNNALKNVVIQKEEDEIQKQLQQKQIEAAKQQELLRQQENLKQQEQAKQQEVLRQQQAIDAAKRLDAQTNNSPKSAGGELSPQVSNTGSNTASNTGSNLGGNSVVGGVTAVGGSGASNGSTGGNTGILPRAPKSYGTPAHKLEGTPNGSLLYRMGQTAQCNDLTRERDERCKDNNNHDNSPPVKVQVKPFPMPTPKAIGKDPLPPCPAGTPHSNFGLSCLPEK